MPRYSAEEREALAAAGKRLGLGKRDSKIADLRETGPKAKATGGEPKMRSSCRHESESERSERMIKQYKLKHLAKADFVPVYDVTKSTRYPEAVIRNTDGSERLEKILKRYSYAMKQQGITPIELKMWREHYMLMSPEQLGALVRPMDIAEYLRVRGETSKVRANREKALFSTIFNHSRAWGYTDITNPCTGIKGFKERPRDRYVSDDEYAAVWLCAHPTVQDAMDLALCTGQRPADVLKIVVTDIAEGCLAIAQNKTGKKLRIAIEGELEEVLARIMTKPRNPTNPALLQDPSGQRLTYFALRSRFDKARQTAGVNFQFRDLRAKAATDTEDLAHAQSLLGHKNRSTTEIYTRDRKGDLVKPLWRKIRA